MKWNPPAEQKQVWERAGIRFVNNVCHATRGRLLSHTEINSKFNLNSSFLDALGLRLSIPVQWRSSLSDEWREPPGHTSFLPIKIGENDPINLANLPSKSIYKELMNKNIILNAAFPRWIEEDDHLSISNQQEWLLACIRAFTAVRETKIQSFQ